MMANIATLWHWPLESMDRMTVEELADWHERARVRNNPENN
jgi:hypothetical protein